MKQMNRRCNVIVILSTYVESFIAFIYYGRISMLKN